MSRLPRLAAVLLAAPSAALAGAAVPAFPGAEGFGTETPGGRGGRIYEVTTLEDCLVPAPGCTAPVPGSLREALQASGPRIIVFRVGGTIEVDWPIIVRNPYVTIAGQTAPGGGIAIRNGPTDTLHALSIQAHDVVIRHVRFRPGRAAPGTEVSDGLNLANGAHHSKAVLAGTSGTQGVTTERVALHHNFMAHNFDRNPRVCGSGRWDVVNNVVFDPGSLMGSDVASLLDYESVRLDVNYVGNYTRRRVVTDPGWSAELRLFRNAAGPGFLVWAQDNLVRDSLTGPDTAADFVCWDFAANGYCEPAIPVAGTSTFALVTGTQDGMEWSLGTNSAGYERANTQPSP